MEKIFNSYTIVNLRDIATKAGLKGHRRFVKKDLVEFMLKNKSKFSDLKEAVKKPRKNAKVVQITAAPKLPKKKKIIKPTAKPKTPPKPIAKSPPKPQNPKERYTLQQKSFRPKERDREQQSTRFRDKDFQIAVFGMTLKQFIKDSESDKKKYYDILLKRLLRPFEIVGLKDTETTKKMKKIANEVIYDKTIKTMKGITDALGGARYRGSNYNATLGAQFRGFVRNNPAFEWDKEQYKPQKQYDRNEVFRQRQAQQQK